MEMTEQQVRQRARKLGLELVRSRTRNPADPAYGGFMLVDPVINGAVAGAEPFAFSLSLEQSERWLATL